MKTFEIEITETLQVIKEIKANNYDEASQIINDKYRNEEIILTSDEYVDTEISPYLYSKSYTKEIQNIEFKNYVLRNAEKILKDMSIEELIKLSFGDIERAIYSFNNKL